MSKVSVGVIGAAGYTGGELLRLLAVHPLVDLRYAQSNSNAGKSVQSVHQDLFDLSSMSFSASFAEEVDCVFLCLPHGQSKQLLATNPFLRQRRLIDLGQDHRPGSGSSNFIYGLPEALRSRIKEAKHVANPGCFATAITLALLPAAAAGWLEEVHVTAITGSTGAGQALAETSHFSWRCHNVSVYKAFSHQHLAEIRATLAAQQPSWQRPLNFVPMRGPFPRGILASAYFSVEVDETSARETYRSYYDSHPFTKLLEGEVHLKQVVNTNHCALSLQRHGDRLHVVAAIDNLLKGACGQAVQNMNLMFDLPESTGLTLKASAF